jgi:hypothetical protein
MPEMLASLVFKENEADLQWLNRRFAMLQDILTEPDRSAVCCTKP